MDTMASFKIVLIYIWTVSRFYHLQNNLKALIAERDYYVLAIKVK